MQITIKRHEQAGASGYRYDAYLGERRLVTAKEPFLAAARTLLAEGCDQNTTLEMVRAGKVALSGRLGALASSTVRENERHGPRLATWTPFPR